MKLLYQYWSILGIIIAIGILFICFCTSEKFSDISTLLWIHFAILLLHQFEEYSYPGSFKEFFNKHIWNKNKIIRFPLNDNGILLVNVVIGWSVYLTSAILGDKAIWLAIGLFGVSLLNGILHSVIFVIRKEYNPGFLTGLFLFVPFGIYALNILLNISSIEVFKSGLFVFFIGILIIPLSIYLTNRFKTIKD